MEGNGVKIGLFLVVVGFIVVFTCWRYDYFGSCPGPPGSLLVFNRGPYQHYAVVVHYGYLIHYTTALSGVSMRSFDVLGSCVGSDVAEIRIQKCHLVTEPGVKVEVENGYWNGKSPLPVEEIVQRAYSKIGKRGYHLMWNNCEHFARWCRYGEKSSGQADMIPWLLLAVFAVFAVCLCWFGRNQLNLLMS